VKKHEMRAQLDGMMAVVADRDEERELLLEHLDHANRRITNQRRALRQMNRAVVERNLRHDDLHQRYLSLRENAKRLHDKDKNEIERLKRTLELAQREMQRKPWWRP
jgi:hypothetical protein